MIDIDLIRKDKDAVIKNLARRGVEAASIESFFELDRQWREVSQQLEQANQKKNASQEKSAASDATSVKQVRKDLEKQEKKLRDERAQAWAKLPNMIFDDVPNGGEKDYQVVETVPEKISAPSFEQKDYLSLAPHLIDTERASKVSGSRFVYIKGQLARLEIALVAFLVDSLGEHGFTPVLPPVLINEKAMAGMGYMEAGADEIYKTQDDLYLVGTSEQAIGPMHMNEILSASDMPIRYLGISPCFRREAGSHGKDVKGILRLHQFDKVEMFSFTTPETSEQEHEFILQRQKDIMAALELPYRVIKLAAQDLGAPSAKTYDIETWIPSEEKYRETHSTSNTTDFQARRLKIRIKDKDGKVATAHMLNGTAVAMSRIFIALVENHQQADGSIAIPKALHPYLPFKTIEATS